MSECVSGVFYSLFLLVVVFICYWARIIKCALIVYLTLVSVVILSVAENGCCAVSHRTAKNEWQNRMCVYVWLSSLFLSRTSKARCDVIALICRSIYSFRRVFKHDVRAAVFAIKKEKSYLFWIRETTNRFCEYGHVFVCDGIRACKRKRRLACTDKPNGIHPLSRIVLQCDWGKKSLTNRKAANKKPTTTSIIKT